MPMLTTYQSAFLLWFVGYRGVVNAILVLVRRNRLAVVQSDDVDT